jgi:uncharacterized membrane protein YkoI
MRGLSGRIVGLLALLVSACAETEQGKSYWLRHAVVTLAQAEIAETNGPGRAVGVELGQSGKSVFYDVEIIDTMNKSRHLRVDAETGKIVKGL